MCVEAELRAAQTAESVQALASRLQSQFESRIKAIKERSAAQAAEADAAEVTFKPSFDVPPQMPLVLASTRRSSLPLSPMLCVCVCSRNHCASTRSSRRRLGLLVQRESRPSFCYKFASRVIPRSYTLHVVLQPTSCHVTQSTVTVRVPSSKRTSAPLLLLAAGLRCTLY